MTRWKPDPAGRLQQAAMELFAERGFEAVTVAEIAERAGLTKRTFFRYFADKREVVFYGGSQLEEVLVAAVAGAPASAGPLDAVAAALDAAADIFEAHREYSARRQQVVAASPELSERELIKFASLAAALAAALRARGVPDPAAILTAEAGIAVLRVAFGRWLEPGNDSGLRRLMREALDELRVVAAT